jgi:sugar phosphate isomerase/epimerase
LRLAGHTYAFRRRSLPEALDELQALGFDAVEVWLGHTAGDGEDAAAELAARGLRVAAISAGGFYEPGDEAAPRAFRVAAALGAPVVVACLAPEVVAEVRALVPTGVTLCLENHWDQPFDRPARIRGAIDRSPPLAACLDTGHAQLAGVRPEAFAAALGPRIRHVHLKDAFAPPLRVRVLGRRLRRRLLERPRPAFPGDGDVSVARVRSALAAASFDGTVTLEHEGDEPAAALRELLARWRAAEPAPAAGG